MTLKVHLLIDPGKLHLYTERLLRILIRDAGVQEVPPDEADLFLVSADDPDDYRLLKKARKLAKDKPLIGGGFEAFGGEWMLHFCDGVSVGEGFDFFDALASARSVDDLYVLPYVMTREKARVKPSYLIDEARLPLVHTGERQWYYLAGRGCHFKCAFCETGFAYPGWDNSETFLTRAARTVEAKKQKLTFITNDSGQLKIQTQSRNAQSVRVLDYLRDPSRFQKASMLHFGIEGWSEEQRRFFCKPIPQDRIYELINALRENRNEAEFFFIAGLPGTWEAMMQFASDMPVSTSLYPRIAIKITRLDPSPHTPLWSYDMRKIERITEKQLNEFHNELKARNIAFRLFPMRGSARQTWRGLLRRCNWEDVPQLGNEPEPGTDDARYMEEIDRRGLGHLLTYDGRPMPNSQVITPHRALRDKLADRRGMMPITYKQDAINPLVSK